MVAGRRRNCSPQTDLYTHSTHPLSPAVILDLSRVVGSHCALLKTFPIPLRHLAVPSHRLVRTSLVLMALAILAHFPPDFLTHLTALSGSDTTPALARLAATLQRGAVNPRDIWNLARTVDRPIPGEGKPGPEPNAADGERTEVRSINRARMALSAALARVIEVAREQGMFDRAAVAREDALKELVTSKASGGLGWHLLHGRMVYHQLALSEPALDCSLRVSRPRPRRWRV